MPNRLKEFRRGVKVVGWSLAYEGDSKTLRRLKKGGEIAIQVIGTVSRIDGNIVDSAVGVVERYVVGGSANEGSEPRHRFLSGAKPGIEIGEDFRKTIKKEFMPQPQRVTVRRDGGEFGAEALSEILESIMTIRIRNGRRPNPLDAERGFSPPCRFNAASVSDSNAGPGTGDGSESFRTELKRDTRFNWDETK